MNPIPLGATHEHSLLVTPEVAIHFLKNPDAQVLSTPHMIAFMEMTSRNLLKSFLPEGWDSVGMIVDVKHLAATPVGMSVRFLSRVTEVDGNRVRFRVDAFDESEQVGTGTHERFVVETTRFAARLIRKRTHK